MGTNYFLYRAICPHCGVEQDKLHIGKSSAGWCFSLHVIPEEGLSSLEDWMKKCKEGEIKDEYGARYTWDELYEIITKRSWRPATKVPTGYISWDDFYMKNYAEPGPNNLLRAKIGPYCLGHGEGTWDLIPGDFS